MIDRILCFLARTCRYVFGKEAAQCPTLDMSVPQDDMCETGAALPPPPAGWENLTAFSDFLKTWTGVPDDVDVLKTHIGEDRKVTALHLSPDLSDQVGWRPVLLQTMVRKANAFALEADFGSDQAVV